MISVNYLTNFKPNTELQKNTPNLTFLSLVKGGRVLCRNMFLYLLFLKFCFTKKIFSKISFFLKPVYENTTTMLRAPYRHKLGKYQFGIKRYFFVCNFFIKLRKDITITNVNTILILNKLLRKHISYFESNLAYIDRIVTQTFFILKKFLTI